VLARSTTASVYAYRSLGARALGVGDWLASAPRRVHRRKPP